MRGVVLRLLVALTILPLLLGTGQNTSAQDDESTYESPTHGYTLTYGGDWTAEDESSEGGYDFLFLTDGESEFYLEGYVGFGGDLAECLETNRGTAAENLGEDKIVLVEDDDGEPISGETDESIYAVYTGEAGGEDALAVYIECRLLDAATVLVITYVVRLDDVGPGLERLEDLLSGLQVSEAAPSSDLTELQEATDADLAEYWTGRFEELGAEYIAPSYVIFDETIETECGPAAPGEEGPFYCPAEQTIYIDQILVEKEVLPYGEFVVSILLAHETGHHVQELLGLTGCGDDSCGDAGSSVAIELQADCLAGAWAQDAEASGEIEEGQVEQTIVAISSYFGDEPGTAADDPEAHGPGALRTWWFLKGYYDGLSVCLPA